MMKIVFLLVFVFFVRGKSNDKLQFKIWPSNTPEKPLRQSRYFEFVPKKKYPWDSTLFFIEHLSNYTNYTVVDTQNRTLRSPFVKLFGKSDHKNYTHSEGPAYVKIRVQDTKKNKILGESEVFTIFWDFRFTSLKFTINFTQVGPCESIITPIPIEGKEDLAEFARYYAFIGRTYPGMALQGGTFTNGKPYYRYIASKPGVRYFQIYSKTGWGGTSKMLQNSPISALGTSWGHYAALVCCSESLGCVEDVHPNWAGVDGRPVHYMKRIKHVFQLGIWSKKVTIIEDVRLNVPFGIGDQPKGIDYIVPPNHKAPDTIEVFLPINMTLDFSFINPDTEHVGELLKNSSSNHYRLTKAGGRWSYQNGIIPLVFKFSGTNIVIGKEYDVFFKLEGHEVYQKLIVVPKPTPKLKNFPQKILSQFTWMGMGSYRTWDVAANLGFNYVSSTQSMSWWGSENIEDSKLAQYTPSILSNSSNYVTVDGKKYGMKYCPEISLFGSHIDYPKSTTPRKLYSLYAMLKGNLKTAGVIDPSYVPATVPDKQLELDKWTSAIWYYNQTGNYDVCYDGYFFDRQFEVLEEVQAFVKPEYVNFDIESWGSYDSYIANAKKSPNCERRRQTGETDEQLIKRVIEEQFTRIEQSVKKNSPHTKVTWYAVRADANKDYQLAPYEVYEKHGFIPQPSIYFEQKNFEIVGMRQRYNKQYLVDKVKELVPMPAPGTYGNQEQTMVFDQCIQLFSNGATGVQYFGGFVIIFLFTNFHRSQIDDHEFYLGHQECLNIFAKYEDIVFDSELGFHDFPRIDNLNVGAIKRKSKYIVAFSRQNPPIVGFVQKKGVAHLEYSHKYYRVKNLRNKKDKIKTKYKNGVIQFEFEPNKLPTVVLIYSYRTTFIIVLVLSILGAICVVLVFAVIVALIVFVAFFSTKYFVKKNKDDVEMGEKGSERVFSDDSDEYE